MHLVAAGSLVQEFGPAPPGSAPEEHGLDCAGATLQPGRVNAHTHAYRSLAAFGLGAQEPPPRGPREPASRRWWRMHAAHDQWSLGAAARLHVAEALLGGTTALFDLHESSRFVSGSLDVIADACQELGVRALLALAVTERSGGREEAERGLVECRRFAICNTRPLVRAAVGLDFSQTVSDQTIREAAALCREMRLPLHVHAGEDPIEQEDAVKRGFRGPLDRLDRLGALGPGTLVAPASGLDQDEVRLARDRGTWLVQTPRAEDPGGSWAGSPAALSESPRVALGTDGQSGGVQEAAKVLAREAHSLGEDRTAALQRAQAGLTLLRELCVHAHEWR